MTEDDDRLGARKARKSGAYVAVAVALGTALYLTLGTQGNDPAAAQCAASADVAQTLDPLVRGEVAAFQVAERPQYLAELSFQAEDGTEKSLADFTGSVTLVNLWATWCAPCREEMPALDRLQAAAGNGDFQVVPISIDTGGPEKAEAFLASVGISHLPYYRDPSTGIFNALKEKSLALGLPVTLILDRNGCHLGHMNGPAEWDSEDGRALIEAAVAATRPAA